MKKMGLGKKTPTPGIKAPTPKITASADMQSTQTALVNFASKYEYGHPIINWILRSRWRRRLASLILGPAGWLGGAGAEALQAATIDYQISKDLDKAVADVPAPIRKQVRDVFYDAIYGHGSLKDKAYKAAGINNNILYEAVQDIEDIFIKYEETQNAHI